MESRNKKLPIYLLLLAMPVIASVGIITSPKSKHYSMSQSTRFRTEAEIQDLRRESLEDALDGLGKTYKSFMEFADLKKTLPTQYDNWKVSIDVNNNFINYGRQNAVDYSEDGLGKVVQIDLSERAAQNFLDKINK